MKSRVPMSKALQDDLVKTLALAGGWIIRAIEEYGVGGEHAEDTEGFLAASQGVLARIGQQFVRLGAVPEGGPHSVADVIRTVLASAQGDGDGA